MRNTCSILVGKPEEKRLRGRPKRRRKDNIRMDLRKIGWEEVDWIHLAQDKGLWWAVVKEVLKLQVL
jgi:hypothetical protein